MKNFAKVNKPNFGCHIDLGSPIDPDEKTAFGNYMKKIACQIVDTTDNLILDGIIAIAKEQGITDLYVLDKHNIVEALKKQIPKKPRLFDCDYSYFECDNCGTAIFYSDEAETHKYCLNCGQALDWSDEE